MNSSGFGKSVIVLLLIILCISSLMLVWALVSIPRQAEQRFGAPSENLSKLDQMWYGGQLLWYEEDLLTPVANATDVKEFEVRAGASANEVGLQLEKAGVIRNADAFRLFLIYAGLDTGLQAGTYQIGANQNAVEIARILQDATPGEVTFVILPGWRAEEIANALSYSGLNISKEAFLGIVFDPGSSTLPDEWRGLVSLEGFLMPGEYKVLREITAQELINTILNAFNEQVGNDLRNRYSQAGLSLRDAVTLASIVEREAMVEREQAIIASVFNNRLNMGMKLDSDPTVQYAVGFNNQQNTWWTNPLSASDLGVDSLYNTYIHIGLPPGPICNPGLPALEAVAYPADTPYYYFRAKCDNSGEHEFSITYEEHLENGCSE